MVAALRAIEQLVLDRDSFKWREQLGLECLCGVRRPLVRAAAPLAAGLCRSIG